MKHSKTQIFFITTITLFLLSHIAFVTLSLFLPWSTSLVIITADRSINHTSTTYELYKATFWTNFNNFKDAGAYALSYLLIFTGIGQPIIKALLLPILAIIPITSSSSSSSSPSRLPQWFKITRQTKTSILLMQELTAKLTMTPSNICVLLLNIITLTFTFKRDEDFTADAVTDTKWGTEVYMVGGVCSCVAVCCIRICCEEYGVRKDRRRGVLSDISVIDPVVSESNHVEDLSVVNGNDVSSELAEPLLRSDNDDNEENDDNEFSSHPPLFLNGAPLSLNPLSNSTSSKTATILLIVLLLATLLLYIPTFTLPLIRFTYTGVASKFLHDPNLSHDDDGSVYLDLTFWKIPTNLYNYTPQKSFAVMNTTLYYATNVIFPILALLLSSIVNHSSYIKARSISLRILRVVLPFIMLDTMVISLFFTAPEIALISEWVFDSNEICELLIDGRDDSNAHSHSHSHAHDHGHSHNRTDFDFDFDYDIEGGCLEINGSVLSGGYWMVACVICADVYIFLTLWREGKREVEEFEEEEKGRRIGAGEGI